MQNRVGVEDRRSNVVQRVAVVTVLARATGTPSIFRTEDGSVFVYDDQRDRTPPVTVRTMISPDGRIGAPVRLPYM
jgi:hypothetical protein